MTNLKSSDLVIEIGSGKGAITKVLTSLVSHVVAIEADPKFASTKYSNVEIIQNDFLKFSLPNQSYKVVSNIPFNITAEIIKKLFMGNENKPEATYLIMQHEAAEKFAGVPKSTLTSIVLQIEYEINILARIGKSEFIPIPKVDAAFISFIKRSKPLIDKDKFQDFTDFIAYGYKYFQWNKPLLNVFDRLFTATQKNLLEKELELTSLKVADIDISKWLKMFKFLNEHIPKEKWSTFGGTMAKLTNEQSLLQKQYQTRSNLS